MRLKETVVKKHIHSWVKTGMKFYPGGWYVERKCSDYDCSKLQHGFISFEANAEFPSSLVHLADLAWVEGPVRDHNPLAEMYDIYGPRITP